MTQATSVDFDSAPKHAQASADDIGAPSEVIGRIFGAQIKEWRRAANLSQMDLALGVGISPRHLSFVENGKSSPSRKLVLRLAKAIDLPVKERNNLLAAAGYAPVHETRAGGWQTLPEHCQQAIDHILTNHEPYPAFATDRLGNVVGSNGAADRFFDGLAAPGLNRNLIRMYLAPGALKACIVNWPEVARAIVNRLRYMVSRAIDDLELQALYEEARLYTESIGLIADEPPRADGVTQFRLGDRTISLYSAVFTLGTLENWGSEIHLEHLFPADGSAEGFFRQPT